VRPIREKLHLLVFIQSQEFKDAWADLTLEELVELNTAADTRNTEKGTIQVKSTPALANLDAAKTIEALSRTVSSHWNLAYMHGLSLHRWRNSIFAQALHHAASSHVGATLNAFSLVLSTSVNWWTFFLKSSLRMPTACYGQWMASASTGS
jgi:hypothetical protein